MLGYPMHQRRRRRQKKKKKTIIKSSTEKFLVRDLEDRCRERDGWKDGEMVCGGGRETPRCQER
jgi:hypothetical protein